LVVIRSSATINEERTQKISSRSSPLSSGHCSVSAPRALYIADASVFDLCEQVCGGIEAQLAAVGEALSA